MSEVLLGLGIWFLAGFIMGSTFLIVSKKIKGRLNDADDIAFIIFLIFPPIGLLALIGVGAVHLIEKYSSFIARKF